MKSALWEFTDPYDGRYAAAGRRGAWSAGTGGVCPECTASHERRVQPLIMAWESGSSLVGDFVWPGFGSEVVATERVFDALEARFAGFERGPVEMVDEPDLARGQQPRVTLPYEGPVLYELWTAVWVAADEQRSSIRLERRCATCGRESWEVEGVEARESTYDLDKQQLVTTHVDRLPGSGIYVPEAALGGADIFRVTQFPGSVFCTDAVRDLVREHEFTNVAFLEMGDVYATTASTR